MINYIWVAFIALAIVYALALDVMKRPPYETPEPTSIVFVEPEPSAEANAAIQIEKSYPFESWKNGETSVSPETVSFNATGDGEAYSVGLTFTDADGDVFVPDATYSLDSESKSFSVSLSGLLTPEHEVPTVSFDLPAQLAIAVRPTGEAGDPSAVSFDNAEVKFAELVHVSGSVKSDRWGGVMTKSFARWADISIDLALGLIGIMMLWLGIMGIPAVVRRTPAPNEDILRERRLSGSALSILVGTRSFSFSSQTSSCDSR